jgi:WhiB family redox-sensing transcriptional regulator
MSTSTAPAVPIGDERTAWLGNAACRNSDPELFFPVGDVRQARAQAEAAKKVCRRCPVRGMCLARALDNGQEAGIWGGMTEGERRRLQARRRPPGRSPYPFAAEEKQPPAGVDPRAD